MNIWYWAGAIVLLGYSVIPTYTAKLLHRVRRKRTGNTLYLTFDDGPDLLYTPQLLQLLALYDIKASFFVVAQFAKQNPALIQRMRDEGQDELHQALLNILANREEELRATIQAIDTRQLRQILSLLRSCEVMEVVSEGGGLPVAFDASIRFSHLGKRCVSSAVHEKNLAFAQTLTPKDILIVLSASGQSARLEEVSAAAKGRDVPVLLITCDSHGPLAQLADYVMTASNREQRLIEGSHAASLLSPNVLIEVLYYLLRMENL